MEQEEIFERITQERDYQDHMCSLNNLPTNLSIDAELLMLKHYIDKAISIRTKDPHDRPALSEIRKITAIGVRCLETHGCPKRDLVKGFLSGDV